MILKTIGIKKTYYMPKTIALLSDISLEVSAGESIAICGRSGEGKTTLLHILGTLDFPDSGEVWIAGEKATVLNSAKLRCQHIGFIFQSYNLLEDFSLLDNVLMPQRVARKTPDKSYGLALLERVGLLARADFPAKLLSGGERQRAAIARALANDPELILADEPTGNLDRENAASIGSLLFDLIREKKKGLVLVTHDPELAAQCSKRYHLKNKSLTLLHP